jgi:hypothetical protein
MILEDDGVLGFYVIKSNTTELTTIFGFTELHISLGGIYNIGDSFFIGEALYVK